MRLDRPATFRPSRLVRRPRRTGGFTLIELLVVILILGIVAGILTVGIAGVRGKMSARSTETRMQALKTMLGEYGRNTAGSAAAGAASTKRPLPLAVLDTNDDGIADADDAILLPPLSTPEDIVSDTNNDPRTVAGQTQLVYTRLRTVPVNKTTFDDFSAEAKTNVLPVVAGNGLAYVDAASAESLLTTPLLLDAWGNVILFVPPAGILGGPKPNSNNPTVYPARLYFENFPLWDGTTDPRLVGADGGAFFMSAGADGLFETADDNLYSTEVIYVDQTGDPIN